MRGCISISGVVGNCIARSFYVRRLGSPGAGDRANTGGDFVSSRLAGVDKMIRLSLFVGAVVVPLSIGKDTLKGAGKKPEQSS